MSHAVWGMLTMAGTYHFSLPYVPPENDDPSRSIVVTLETSSSSEEAAAAEVAAVLQRMSIDWLTPLGTPHGPWRIDRRGFAAYFDLSAKDWLIGEQILRPALDREEVAGSRRMLLRFVLAPDGPLAWSWGAAPETPWGRVEYLRAKLQRSLEIATSPDDFQHVGLLSRDLEITCAKAVYDRAKHPQSTDKPPGKDDAKRMLADFLAVALRGEHATTVALVNAVWDSAVHLQHKRAARYTEAVICSSGVLALVEIIRVLRRS